MVAHQGGGMLGCSGGACVVAHGGGRVWLLMGGHAWLLSGGVRGCSWGGHACFFFLNEVRSMSGRYASYWNAFLLNLKFSFSFPHMG